MKKYLFFLFVLSSQISSMEIIEPAYLKDIIGKEVNPKALEEAEFGKTEYAIGELVVVKRTSDIYTYACMQFADPDNENYLTLVVGYDRDEPLYKKVLRTNLGKLPLTPIIWPVLNRKK